MLPQRAVEPAVEHGRGDVVELLSDLCQRRAEAAEARLRAAEVSGELEVPATSSAGGVEEVLLTGVGIVAGVGRLVGAQHEQQVTFYLYERSNDEQADGGGAAHLEVPYVVLLCE